MATGDILSGTIRADSWSLDAVFEGFTTSATYNFGLDANNNPTAATPYIDIVSEGYNAAGVLGTVTRRSYIVAVVRKAYPDEAEGNVGVGTTKDETGGGNLTTRFALSEPVYNDDKNGGAGTSGTDPVLTAPAGWVTNSGGGGQASNAATALTCTNNSTLDYPKVIGQWDSIAGVCRADRLKAAFRLAFNARHKFGIAAVRLDATGQTSAANVNETVTSETATQRTGSGLYATAYRSADFAISGFTQGELITGRARVYPVVGDADSILDTDTYTTAGDLPYGYNQAVYLCDKNNALDDIVYVSTTGNDTTGDGSLGNPYATIAKGVAEGNIVKLLAGSHNFGSSATRKTGNEWTIIQPNDGLTSADVTVKLTTTRAFKCQWLQVADCKIQLTDATSYADGENAGNTLRWNRCLFDGSGVAAPSTAPGYRTLVTYFHNCTGDLCNTEWTIKSFSTNRVALHFDGCTLAESSASAAVLDAWYRCVACSGTGALCWAEKSASNPAPTHDNVMFDFNRMLSFNSTARSSLRLGEFIAYAGRGVSICGNVCQKTAATSAAWYIGGDGSNVNMDHIIIWHNTVAGQRLNIGYNDAGTNAPTRTSFSQKYNSFRDWNNKDDTFATANAARVNAWPVGYNVGSTGNTHEINTFPGEFMGLNYVLAGDGLIAYVDAANGDYTPASNSVLKNRVASNGRVLLCDLYGTSIRNNGTGDGGGIQTVSAVSSVRREPTRMCLETGIAI